MKPEELYRQKIDVELIKHFEIQREVYSLNGLRLDYVLKCKLSGALFGLEVKSELRKKGLGIGLYLKQASNYGNEFWKAFKFNSEPIKLLIFITPAVSNMFIQIDRKNFIEHNGKKFYEPLHPLIFKHHNINSGIGECFNIGELRVIREYGGFALMFMNNIIWETNKYGTKFNQVKYNHYLK